MSQFYYVTLTYSPIRPTRLSEDNCECPRMLRDGKWVSVESDNDGEWPDLPSVWIDGRAPLWLGTYELSGRRVHPGSYLSDSCGCADWEEIMDMIVEKLLPDGKRFDHETALGCLARVEHVADICWETGHDEGGFEVAEILDTILFPVPSTARTLA